MARVTHELIQALSKLTKADLDALESTIAQARNYFDQPAYYDHASPLSVRKAEDRVLTAEYICGLLRTGLQDVGE